MMTAKAFAPGNISCIFVIRKGKNPSRTGSLGLGFTVNKGVFVTIKKITNTPKQFNNKLKNKYNNKKDIKNIIYFNNKKIKLSTIKSVTEKLTNEAVLVNIKSELPLGYGFGISGASALATSYALNKLLNLKISKKGLALIAHVAEVENGTGLGDVVNQYYGGFLIKYKPSYMFKVYKIPIKNKNIYYKYFSSINTTKIISNKKSKDSINLSGIKALNKIQSLNIKNINLKNLIKISKEFSVGSSLLQNKKIINIIKKIESKGGNASMIMLGNSVFSDIYFKGSMKLIIKEKGACLL